MQGKLQIPLLKEPPTLIDRLLSERVTKSKHFCENIRAYNSMFSLASMGILTKMLTMVRDLMSLKYQGKTTI